MSELQSQQSDLQPMPLLTFFPHYLRKQNLYSGEGERNKQEIIKYPTEKIFHFTMRLSIHL